MLNSRMVTGDAYFAAITARAADRRARSAFRDLVCGLVEPGVTLFDFGAGPGIDAKFYAACGYRVMAYDADPEMCRSFERHCSEEITAGRVQLLRGTYDEFLAAATPRAGECAIVTANFAPLSLIDDLPELFARLHPLMASGGRVVASVLNPSYAGDAKYRWWWANRLRFWRHGQFSVRGATGNIHRRSLANLAAMAAPWFTLEAATRGLPATRLSRLLPFRPLALATSLYTFVVLRRT